MKKGLVLLDRLPCWYHKVGIKLAYRILETTNIPTKIKTRAIIIVALIALLNFPLSASRLNMTPMKLLLVENFVGRNVGVIKKVIPVEILPFLYANNIFTK